MNNNNNTNHDKLDDLDEQHLKSKIIKCKTNNISSPNGSSSPTIRSIDVPNNFTSIKLHIRCGVPPPPPPSSSKDTNLHSQTTMTTTTDPIPIKITPRQFFNTNSDSTIPHSRRVITTRRTSLIESDLSQIPLPKTSIQTSIPDENTLKKSTTTTKANGFKRTSLDEQTEKKRQKITTPNTSKSSDHSAFSSILCFEEPPTTPVVQTRSSSRLKQKHRQSNGKRRLSTEIPPISKSDFSTFTDDLPSGEYKYPTSFSLTTVSIDNHCQIDHDLLPIADQKIQTNSLIKIEQSTGTDFIDEPVCDDSTQTIQKADQEVQTIDLYCQTDSPVSPVNETPHDRRSPRPSHENEQPQQQTIPSTPFVDLPFTSSNEARLRLFESLIRTEEHPNGGGIIIRAYHNEFVRLSTENLHLFVNYFFNCVYGEVNQRAKCSIGVLHDGARDLPDLVDYFSLTYPKMTVKTTNILNSKEVLTTTMGEYRNRVVQTYSNGTFRHGPLMSISLVGTVTGKEECGKRSDDDDLRFLLLFFFVGDYFPAFLDKLEENPFLRSVMPWGTLSSQKMKSRTDSNDGPILWVRPGEQYVPTAEHKICHPKKRLANELRNLSFTGRGTDPREVLVEDRTKPHSDHCDSDGLETTAAVGILKAVHVGTS